MSEPTRIIRDGAREALKTVDAWLYRGGEDHVLKAVVAFTTAALDAESVQSAAVLAEAQTKITRLLSLNEEWRSESHIQKLLDGRDQFIVAHGLWNEFVASLSAHPDNGKIEEASRG